MHIIQLTKWVKVATARVMDIRTPSLRRRLGSCLWAILLTGLQFPASAQNVPTPGQVREQLRPPAPVPTQPPPGLAPTVESASPLGVPPGGRAVLVSGFEITGNRGIDTAVLQEAIAGYVGQPLTLAQIYEVADVLTRLYRNRGFTLASAYVPEQKIQSGVIRLEVLEGTLGAVKAETTGRTRPGFVNWQLDRLHAGDVLRNEPLENELLLLNDIPGLQAKAVVRPGADYGTSDLVVTTTEDRFDGDVRYNNYGRESIGEERLEGTAGLNGLLGYGDRLDVNAVYAEGDMLHYVRGGYSIPVSPWGTRASVYYASWEYVVGTAKLGFPGLVIEGDGQNWGVRVDHPLWRSQTVNLSLGFGLDRTNTEQRDETVPSAIVPSRQNLTLANFSAFFSYAAQDNSFSTIAANFSTNFNSADLEQANTAVEDNAQTAKLQLDLTHYRPLYQQLALATRFTGVVSVDPLVDLERFRLGGPASVRAFASSELAGDSGFMFTAELQHPIPIFTGIPMLFKAFVDTGRVYQKHYNLRGLQRQNESISGAGLGLQATVYNRIFIDVAIAEPFGAHETQDTNRGLRFWTNVSARF